MENNLSKWLRTIMSKYQPDVKDLAELSGEQVFMYLRGNENCRKRSKNAHTTAILLWMSGWLLGTCFLTWILAQTGVSPFIWNTFPSTILLSISGIGVVLGPNPDFFRKIEEFGKSYWWIALIRGLLSGIIGRLIVLIVTSPNVLENINLKIDSLLLGGG